jgi:chloride channel protein, CIC family
LIPVAIASVAACATRRFILGLGPLFPAPAHPVFIGIDGLLGCIVAGLAAGALSALLTAAVYAAEDFFLKVPIHWMWWPALGGLVIGLGGLIFPQALGTGYATIAALLQGDVPRNAILGILLVKSVMWSVSLGSGTSGGVLAPLLMMGGALGGIEAQFLPHEGIGFWPLVSMGAILGGTMRSPFTGVIFMLELTHDVNMMLPLLLAVTLAHGFTVLTLKRSILTEKVARRGYHLSREYTVDPLELLFTRDVMRKNVVAFPADTPCETAALALHPRPERRGQFLYPVVDSEQRLTGVITRGELQKLESDCHGKRLVDLANKNPVVAYVGEPVRAVVHRMADSGRTRLPVVAEDGKLAGMISLRDLLLARTQSLDQERRRERLLRIHLPFVPSAQVVEEAVEATREN